MAPDLLFDPVKAMEEIVKCSVCMDTFSDPRVLPCFHPFCRKCLEKHVSSSWNPRCPLCNKNYTKPENGFPKAIYQAKQLDIYKEMIGDSNQADERITPNTDDQSQSEVSVVPPEPFGLITRKLGQFDIFINSPDHDGIRSITCTPAGNIIVCGRHVNEDKIKVRMFTPEGNKVLELQTPQDMWVEDVDCNDTHIYVADCDKESVLVFDYQGHLVDTNVINQYVCGISVTNQSAFVAAGDAVYKFDLIDGTKLSNRQKFVSLEGAHKVCVRGDVAAISCWNYTAHFVDSNGRIKYTYGIPGESGYSPGLLNCPVGVVLDSNNTMFIADRDTRIFAVSEEGCLLGIIHTYHRYGLYSMGGLALDNEGNLLVGILELHVDLDHLIGIAKFGYNF
jgi:hypothetical protein